MPSSPDEPLGRLDAKTSLSVEILALLAKITGQFASGESEGWQWIIGHSANPQVVELLQDSTTTALRVLDAIGRLEPVNGAKISEQFHIPKGTVSKVTRRLIAKNVICTESLPQNKKEILFRLTALGQAMFEVHRAFDEQMERGFLRFLERYDPDELRLLVRILREATEASFLTLGLETAPQRPKEE